MPALSMNVVQSGPTTIEYIYAFSVK